MQSSETKQRGPSSNPYQNLVAVGEPDQLTMLLSVAVPIARARQGRVLPLYVGTDGSAPEWLQIPHKVSDVVEDPEIIASSDAGAGILEVARKRKPALLLLQWKGRPARGRYLLGPTLDPVIQYAPCDVVVLRAMEEPSLFSERMANLQRVLVPFGGGPNASLALELAFSLGPGFPVTALRIARSTVGTVAMSAQREMLQAFLEAWSDNPRLRPEVVLAPGVLEGILDAAQNHDLVLVGATRESFVDRLLFGNLPQLLGAQIPGPMIIVRRYDPGTAGALRRVRWHLLGLLPQLTHDERVSVYRQVRRSSRTSKDYYVMMTLAAIISSLGLLLNSSAVIIGAMLVAPLMSALLGIGLGVVQGDYWLLRVALRTTLLGALLVVSVSAAVGLLVPGRSVTDEMLNRGTPAFLDLAVALVSGAAAAYAIARRGVSSALPGVAIAVALVPPLSTAGIASVSGDMRVASGAVLLFVTNLVAIVSAAVSVLLWIGFRPNSYERDRARTFKAGLAGIIAVLFGVAVTLGWLSVHAIRRASLEQLAGRALIEHLSAWGSGVRLTDWRINEARDGRLGMEVSIESAVPVTRQDAVALERRLANELGRPVSLELTVIPVARYDAMSPLAPPSPAPTARLRDSGP